jgi:predicted PurR-regulated permease PerM
MSQTKPGLYFLLASLLGVTVLSFFILQPFLYPLILAMIAATVFHPIHTALLRRTKGEGALAALLSTLVVCVVVIVPLTFLVVQIFQEATVLYTALAHNGSVSLFSGSVQRVLQDLASISPVPLAASVDVQAYITQVLQGLLRELGPLFASFAKILISTFIFLVALYYFFKDGIRLKKSVVALSPLQDVHDETIFSKLAIAVNSVVRGNLAVACIQGLLTAIGFALFGVPNPALWGGITAIAALVPSVGTSLIVAPAIAYLYFTGAASAALGLLVWGVLAIGLVDNILGPKFVERGMRIHPLLILLSILGGISLFGPMGFLLGPIVLALLFALLEIYGDITRDAECA